MGVVTSNKLPTDGNYTPSFKSPVLNYEFQITSFKLRVLNLSLFSPSLFS